MPVSELTLQLRVDTKCLRLDIPTKGLPDTNPGLSGDAMTTAVLDIPRLPTRAGTFPFLLLMGEMREDFFLSRVHAEQARRPCVHLFVPVQITNWLSPADAPSPCPERMSGHIVCGAASATGLQHGQNSLTAPQGTETGAVVAFGTLL